MLFNWFSGCFSFISPSHCHFRFSVAPICYAHLAAQQMGQFIKFEDIPEASSSPRSGSVTNVGGVPVQELPRLHENVQGSMFFC